jgi:hypothetical protein
MTLQTNFLAVNTATTAAVGATAKVTALCTGIMDAVHKELSVYGPLNGAQQNVLAIARANVVTNIAALQTSLGL